MIKLDKTYEEDHTKLQYPDLYDPITGGKGRFKAKYLRQEEITFVGNPLIEALPPIKSKKELRNLIFNPPVFREDERNLPDMQRIIAASRLYKCLFPIVNNFEVYKLLSISIRRGYATKNIEKAEYTGHIRKIANTFKMKDENNINIGKYAVNDEGFHNSNGFLLVGKSGCGKSTAIEACISLYPKSITHISAEPERALFVQIPIVKIVCSANGSVKGLCDNFFGEVDRLAGTSYYSEYNKGKGNTDSLISAVRLISMLHGVGVIVVDEIEQLNGLKTSRFVMNFLVNLSNQLKVPIIYVGTYEVLKGTLGNVFKLGRRADGIKSVKFDELKVNGEYTLFMKNLWKYQWNREYVSLDDEILKVMYEQSNGIIDKIIKIFVNAQIESIGDRSEKITSDLIRRVGRDDFTFTSDMNSLGIIFGDTFNKPGVTINRDYSSEERTRKEIINDYDSLDANNISSREAIFNELLRFATEYNDDYKSSVNIVNMILDEFPLKTDIKKLKREFVKRMERISTKESDKSLRRDSKPRKTKETANKLDNNEIQKQSDTKKENEKFIKDNTTKDLF